MKKICSLILLFLIWFCSFHISLAQTNEKEKAIQKSLQDVIKQTDVVKLKQLALEYGEEFRLNKQRALDSAAKYGWQIKLYLPDSSIAELVGIDIKGKPIYYKTNNLNAAKTIQTSKVWLGGGMGLDLSGQGMTIREWDEGVARITHQEFQGRVTNADGAGASSHGTHVGGTLISAGAFDANSKGGSYKANLRSFDWNGDVSEMATEAANGMLLSNHSYGQVTGWDGCKWYGDETIDSTFDYKFGFYSGTTAAWDNVAFNAPYYLPCKAAGNDRSDNCGTPASRQVFRGGWVNDPRYRAPDGQYDNISTYGNAKNALTVAAVNDIPGGWTNPASVSMSGFSSWGPTDDGRIKPDVSANGVGLYSTETSADNAYSSKSGTSMATPSACGSANLIQEHYRNITGGFMKAATLKGLICHSADEAGANPGPDYSFGWGLMNTAKAVTVINNNNVTTYIKEESLTQSQTYTYQVYSDGSLPLKATICWTDPAGTPSSPVLNDRTPRLVNDLDVRISNGTTFLPWILDPDNPATAAAKGDNYRDNVEQVYIATPVAGMYTITVTHKGTLRNGMQNFSLIISDVQCFAAIAQPTQTTICTGDNLLLTANTGLGLTYQWSRDGIDIPLATASTLTVSTTGAYRVRVTRGGCVVTSEPLNITVNPATIPGTVAIDQTVCAGTDVNLTLSGNVGDVLRWESSIDNFVTINTIASTQTNILFPQIAKTTKFRAVVKSGVCLTELSNAVTITITGNGGTTSSPLTVCAENNTGTINLTGNSGSVAYWESSTDNWLTSTNIANNTPSLTFNNLLVTTAFRARVVVPMCPEAPSTPTIITVIPQQDITAGVSPSSPICGVSPVNLTATINPFPPYDDCTQYISQTLAAVPFLHAGTNVFAGAVDDGVSGPLNIGFPFTFFCNTYTTFKVSSNGFIGFSNVVPNGCCDGGWIPSSDGLNNLITLMWTDGNVNNTNDIKYQTTGTAPNRKCVISFGNTYKYFGEPSPVVGQIVLYETSNIVEIIATSIPTSGKIRTLGIENETGTAGYSPTGKNAAPTWSASNTTYRYTPFNSPANITYSWTNSGNGFSASTPNANDPNPPIGNSNYVFQSTHAATGCTKTITIPYTVDIPTVAGTLNSSANLCYGANSGTLTLSGSVGNILRWESSTDNFTTIITITNNTPTQNYLNLIQDTKYRVVVKSGSCSELISNEILLDVTPQLTAIVSSSPSIETCVSTPVNLSIAPNYIAPFNNAGEFTANWTHSISPFTASGLNVSDPTPLPGNGTYFVTLTHTPTGCQFNGSVNLQIDDATVAGAINFPATVCAEGNFGTINLTGQTGSILRWESSTDNFTTVTTIVNNTPTLNYSGLINDTKYRAVVQSGVCATLTTNEILITVSPATIAGTLSADASVCAEGNSGTLTLSGSQGSIIRWESSTDNFVTAIPIVNTNPFYNYNNLLQTTQFRAVVQADFCGIKYSNLVTITVSPATIPGTLSPANLSVCEEGNSGTITLTGNSITILRWESSTDNFVTFTTINNVTNNLNYSNLAMTTSYRVAVKNGFCPEKYSTISTITVNPPTIAGTLSADASVCAEGNSGTLTLSGSQGSIIRWESSTDNFVTAIPIVNTNPFYNYNNLLQTTQFRAVVQADFCGIKYSNLVTITVSPATIPGTLSPANLSVCEEGNSGTITLTGNSITILRWESSTDNFVTFTTINNVTNNLNYSNLAMTTSYRVAVKNGFCPEKYSTISTITVNPPTIAGTLSADASVCAEGNSGTLTLSGSQGSIIRWESSTDNFVTVTTIVNTNPTYNYNNLLQTTQFRVVVQSGACPVRISSPVNITVDAATVGGVLSPGGNLCANQVSGVINLTGYVGQILRWESSTDFFFTNTPINNTTSTLNFSNLTVATRFRAVVKNNSCSIKYSSPSIVNITPITLSGTLTAPKTFCGGNNSGSLKLTGYRGQILYWEYSVDNWATVRVINNQTPVLNFNNLAQSTKYRVVVMNSPCNSENSNEVEITIIPRTVAGTLSARQTVCASGNSGILKLTGHTGSVLYWISTTNNWVTTTTISNTQSTYSFSNLTRSTLFKVVVRSGNCQTLTTNQVAVTVVPSPNPGILIGEKSFCNGINSGILKLTGAQGNIIRWESSSNNFSTITTINTTTPTLAYLNLTETTEFRVVIKSGVCGEKTGNPVKITIYQTPVAGTLSSSQTICDNPGTVNLNLSGHQGNIIRWEKSENNFITHLNIANQSPNYTENNLRRNAQYRVVLANGNCPEIYSDQVDITVLPSPIPGQLYGSTTLCTGKNSGYLTLSGQIAQNIIWEKSIDNGNTWMVFNNPNSPYFFYQNLSQTTDYRVRMNNANACGEVITSARISISRPTVAGTLDGNRFVCTNNPTGTLSLSGYYGNVVRWESSIDNWVTIQPIMITANTLDFTVSQNTAYRVIVQNGACPPETSNVANITLLDEINAGILINNPGSTSNCVNPNGIMVLSGYIGNIVRWESSTDNWNTITMINNTTPNLSYSNLPTTTQYRVAVDGQGCGLLYSNIIVAPGSFTSNVTSETGCGSLGYISMHISGGLPPYTVTLSGNNKFLTNNSGTFEALPPGNYFIMIKDSRGCMITKTVIVSEQVTKPIITNIDAITPNAIRLTWSTIMPGPPTVSYEFSFRKVGEMNWTIIQNYPNTLYTLWNLLSSTSYEAKVRAECINFQSYSEYSDPVTFRTDQLKVEKLSTGISEVMIYPNPNRGSFMIDFETQYQGYATVKVFDPLSREIFNKKSFINPGKNNLPIELKGYASGIYILTIETGKINTYAKIVIE